MATYHYENSDPERFQELCQALLVGEFSGLQCFPVGQRDGGRDAVAPDVDLTNTIILQVKFKRHDDDSVGHADWLIRALEGERTKIAELVNRGARRYIMVTNARGTGAPGGGSIDKVNAWMEAYLPVPGTCLWRDDLDRRLDANFSLKWRYPEVLSGTDGIRLALESHLSEDADRRARAIKAFTIYQFTQDAEVRFKQVDLRNDLFELFIDVPAKIDTSHRAWLVHSEQVSLRMLNRRSARVQTSSSSYEVDNEDFALAYNKGRFYYNADGGAASLILNRELQLDAPRLVLEGAPGQGKSTLAQYVCQVHRARYLGKTDIVEALAPEHGQAPVRLPVKVDLRDLAVWLDGRDPLLSEHPEVASNWTPTLEAFLAHMISSQSGGIEFTPYDVTRTFSEIPTLLFLDGLDEVADIEMRETLIDEVDNAVERISSDSDIQVVITTRPAAFANSPGFSAERYSYLELTNIDPDMALEYTDKWIRARELDERDAIDVRNIFREKLALPHIRDLARNPMQLAILLSLIHSVGYSLPDKRTELYGSYMERFLTREAEKSYAVRQHRQLLVRIHQYLAWVLQVQAEEARGTSGSVTAAELRQIIEQFLREHEYPLSILDDLFTGMLERVYVLVQRIEGAYEFEVQPIREYFCATHLYQTAAPSTGVDGGPCGTKDERFDAMARNAYWTNVTRFYAGSYTSGELGNLYFRLVELKEDSHYALTSRPRQLGAMLLGDWVFKESPRVTKSVAQCVFDDIGLKAASVGFSRDDAHGFPLSLPRECGREELAKAALNAIDRGPGSPSAPELARLLSRNGGDSETEWFLARIVESSGRDRTRWITLACEARALESVNGDEWDRILRADSCDERELSQRVTALVEARPSVASDIAFVGDIFIESCLRGEQRAVIGGADWPGFFAMLLSPSMSVVRREHWVPHLLVRRSYEELLERVPERYGEIASFMRVAGAFMDTGTSRIWGRSLAPWNGLVESAREQFSDTWVTCILAAQAAGVQAKDERGRGASNLFQVDVPLCERARYARLWRGGESWWLNQLANGASDLDVKFWVLLTTSWARPQVLAKMAEDVGGIVDGLSDADFADLVRGADDVGSLWSNVHRRDLSEILAFSITDKLRLLLLLTSGWGSLSKVSWERLLHCDVPIVHREAMQRYLLAMIRETDPSQSEHYVARLRDYYHEFGAIPYVRPNGELPRFRPSVAVAEQVLGCPLEHPYEVVAACERVVGGRLKSVSIGSISEAQGWTFE